MGYIPGDYKMTCDLCGFVFRKSQMTKRWDGLWVCKDDYEVRHPQEYMVRPKGDKQAVPQARPVPPYIFKDMADRPDPDDY